MSQTISVSSGSHDLWAWHDSGGTTGAVILMSKYLEDVLEAEPKI